VNKKNISESAHTGLINVGVIFQNIRNCPFVIAHRRAYC